MNKWILIPLTVIAVPVVALYMWVRHPVMCWRGIKDSFNLCVRGKDK